MRSVVTNQIVATFLTFTYSDGNSASIHIAHEFSVKSIVVSKTNAQPSPGILKYELLNTVKFVE